MDWYRDEYHALSVSETTMHMGYESCLSSPSTRLLGPEGIVDSRAATLSMGHLGNTCQKPRARHICIGLVNRVCGPGLRVREHVLLFVLF